MVKIEHQLRRWKFAILQLVLIRYSAEIWIELEKQEK